MSVPNHPVSLSLTQFRPALNTAFWADSLPRVYSPDDAEALMRQILHGVRIGRPPADSIVISHNWPSSLEFRSQVTDIISRDLEAGRLLGPFFDVPFDACIVSPLGAFPKRNSSAIRLIHDLSYPSVGSVNSLISSEDFSVSYSSIDDAVRHCLDCGPGPLYLAKIDLKDAFKHIFIAPQDWPLMGLSWFDPAGRIQYYFSKVLNFGLRSAPAIFDRFASALERFMLENGAPKTIVRYVDDFLVVCRSEADCDRALTTMLSVTRAAGFTVQDSKVTSPSPVVEFLGIVVDTVRGELRISESRLVELKSEVEDWIQVRTLTKRRLLSLIGKCAFAARVIRHGRPFLARLFSAAKSARALHHRVRLGHQALADLRWWSRCIAAHNGISYFRPDWTGDVIHIHCDASGIACGAVCRGEWFYIAYTGNYAPYACESINWREFQVAVTALATWAPMYKGHCIIFHIDNMTVCHVLNGGHSTAESLMFFLRHWCHLVETYNLTVAPVYINTLENIDADDLSRLRIDAFRARNLEASPFMTWPNQDFMSHAY